MNEEYYTMYILYIFQKPQKKWKKNLPDASLKFVTCILTDNEKDWYIHIITK